MDREVKVNGVSRSIDEIVQSGGAIVEKSDSIEELYEILALIGDLVDRRESVEGVTDIMSVDPVKDILPRRLYAVGALTRAYRHKEFKRNIEPSKWRFSRS